jgi:curved DNA-binding protein CbpA
MGKEEARAVLDDESPWQILNIPPGSALDIIKAAFRKLILKHHPDHGGSAELARKIIAAYSFLTQ